MKRPGRAAQSALRDWMALNKSELTWTLLLTCVAVLFGILAER